MIAVLVALWLTFQAGGIVGYLIADHHPRQRRYPIPPPIKFDRAYIRRQLGRVA